MAVVEWSSSPLPLSHVGSVGKVHMAARGIGDRLEKWLIFFCLGCSASCLGVAAKLIVPELPAAEKTVVRLRSWVR